MGVGGGWTNYLVQPLTVTSLTELLELGFRQWVLFMLPPLSMYETTRYNREVNNHQNQFKKMWQVLELLCIPRSCKNSSRDLVGHHGHRGDYVASQGHTYKFIKQTLGTCLETLYVPAQTFWHYKYLSFNGYTSLGCRAAQITVSKQCIYLLCIAYIYFVLDFIRNKYKDLSLESWK